MTNAEIAGCIVIGLVVCAVPVGGVLALSVALLPGLIRPPGRTTALTDLPYSLRCARMRVHGAESAQSYFLPENSILKPELCDA
jgi:hypothetical protein